MSKLTKEQLQGMSDFEVNRVLAMILDDFETPPDGCVTEIIGNKLFYRNRHHGSYFECHKGYCEEPNDIMPLAFENRICIDWFSDGRCLATFGGLNEDFDYQSTNPLRAIACCLILVLQEKSQCLCTATSDATQQSAPSDLMS